MKVGERKFCTRWQQVGRVNPYVSFNSSERAYTNPEMFVKNLKLFGLARQSSTEAAIAAYPAFKEDSARVLASLQASRRCLLVGCCFVFNRLRYFWEKLPLLLFSQSATNPSINS